jgi:apolipoprotein D and lipocalin family protein
VIYELDSEDYNYAFVSGMNTDYLWLLSRTPELSEALINKFKQQANSYGFDVENLIMIEHKAD